MSPRRAHALAFLTSFVTFANDAHAMVCPQNMPSSNLNYNLRTTGTSSIGPLRSMRATRDRSVARSVASTPTSLTDAALPGPIDAVETRGDVSEAGGESSTSRGGANPVHVNDDSFRERLNRQELRLMRQIQRIPGLRPVSLAIHYSLMPQVVTPALAMIAWLVSLPAAASLICFVCAQDIINTAIKWAVNRPRPLWSSSDTGLDAKYGACSWEADYSFPSAHTQFFSGLAFCACVLSGCTNMKLGLGLASGFGAVIGVTRNYLGVHWPTDTTFGLLLGGLLGILWGKYDPYAWLLRSGSPLLSLGFATLLTGALTLLLVGVRAAVPPVDEDTLSTYCANVYSSLPQELRGKESFSFMPRPRELRAKISMLVTVWCTLAFTALCPAHLPTALAEPMGQAGYRLTQATVGIGGLSGFGVVLKRTVVNRLPKLGSREGYAWLLQGETKVLFKGLAYAGICAWTFLLSQLASHRLLALFG